MDLAELYRDTRPQLLAFARRGTGGESAAQECVAETFARLVGAWPRLDFATPEAARAYLYKTLRRLMFAPAWPSEELDPERLADERDPRDEVILLLSEQVTQAELQCAITALPESLRTPLLLFHCQRVAHREIATRLGITSLAVAMRLFKARRKLRVLLTAALATRGVLEAEQRPGPAPSPSRGAR